MPLRYGLVKLAGSAVLVQLAFPTSHSHCGFSPVITQLLIKTQNRFNGLPFRHRGIRSFETVKAFRESE